MSNLTGSCCVVIFWNDSRVLYIFENRAFTAASNLFFFLLSSQQVYLDPSRAQQLVYFIYFGKCGNNHSYFMPMNGGAMLFN